MKKNIIIVGPSRAGKSTLANMISHELHYNMIRLDDLVSGFEYAFPELGIHHDSEELKVSTRFTKFLSGMLRELNEGDHIYRDEFYVLEGVFIDFEELQKEMESDKNKDNYTIIGLHYNGMNEEQLFKNIRNHDTDDDWTYYNDDEELKANCRYFLQRNNNFYEDYKKYNIKNYDVSFNREITFNKIIDDIKNRI